MTRPEPWETRPLCEQVPELEAHRAKLMVELAKLDFQSVMEIGCGCGQNLQHVSHIISPSIACYGIDPSPERVGIARARNPYASIWIGYGQYVNGQYDLVLSDAVCMTLENPVPLLQAMWGATRKWLVLSEWNLRCMGSQPGDALPALSAYYVHDYEFYLGRPANRSMVYDRADWPAERCDNWWRYGRIMVWEREMA